MSVTTTLLSGSTASPQVATAAWGFGRKETSMKATKKGGA